MTLLRRLRAFLQSVPHRLTGAHIDLECETLTHLSSKARFPADELLERRIKAAREVMGPVEPKRLIEEHPDTFKRPIEVPEGDL